MSYQRVVCIVPLGALGVQPDAAVDNEVAELRQQGYQQFFCQVNKVNVVSCIVYRLAIGTNCGDPGSDNVGEGEIVADGGLGISAHLFKRVNPVGDMGIGEDWCRQQFRQSSRVMVA